MSHTHSRPSRSAPFAPPPDAPVLTEHDRAYSALYLRLLDADAAGIPWQTAARDILGLDPERDRIGARQGFDAFLNRAKWMTTTGYKLLLKSGA